MTPRIHHYFPHIDGIRCLAIIPVVMYHLAASLCPGGFMGVDVFFVISGYLICGGIMRDLQEERFSLKSFYFRRIRRIFPAYFALVTGVLLAGVLFYHWGRLLPLAQTALASTAFSANLYFWLITGYFNPTAHENPLLHLWSLGIEEQFYIIVPLTLLVLWKIKRSWVMPVVFLGAVGSLLACVVLGEMGESTTVFYILPTRAWELLAGALICTLPAAPDSRRSGIFGLVGLMLVIVPYWALGTGNTFGEAGTSVELLFLRANTSAVVPFPGWVTIPVIVGTILLIRYGGGRAVGKLLSSRPFVGIGKISYSLYLWHWPIFVFVGYIAYGHQNLMLSATALVLSFLCAYMSWRWVETPVRMSGKFTPGRAFYSAGIGCGILAFACGALIMTQGLRWIVHKPANIYAGAPRPFMPNLQDLAPPKADFRAVDYPGYDEEYIRVLGDPGSIPRFCMIGDSHAAALAPGMDVVAAENGRSGYYLARRVDPYVKEKGQTRRIFEWIGLRREIEDVYIVDRWLNQFGVFDGLPELGDKGTIEKVVLDPEVEIKMRTNLQRTVNWWRARGKRVSLFSCVPEYLYSPGDIMARSQIIPLDLPIEITEQDYRNRQAPVTRMHLEMAEAGLIRRIPLGEAFLERDDSVFMAPDGSPYYKDADHLSRKGARRGIEFVSPILWPDPDENGG